MREDHIAGQEEMASNINNGGLESQIEFLLEHRSAAKVEDLIRQA